MSALGGALEVTCERELVGVSMNVHKNDAAAALNLLLEMVTSTKVNETQLEAEKENVHALAKETARDQNEYCMESLFYTTFIEHQVGQPKNGNRDVVSTLTVKDIESHRDNTFVGKNFAVVVSGDVDHQTVETASNQWLGSLPTSNQADLSQQGEKPYMTPSMMSITDHERDNLNSCASFVVPGLNDTDHMGMHLVQEVLGNYNASENGMAHVNSPHRQYNRLHQILGQRPGLNLFRTQYHGFSDFGVMTTWQHGHEIYSNELMYLGQWYLGYISRHLNQADVFRARARVFNNLLS